MMKKFLAYVRSPRRLGTFLFWVVVLAFFTHTLLKNMGTLATREWTIEWGWLVPAFAALLLTVVWWGVLWRSLVIDLGGERLSWSRTIYVQFLSWVGRYIPGPAGVAMGKVVHGTNERMERKPLLLATTYEHIFQVVSGALLGGVIFVFALVRVSEVPTFALILVLAGGVSILHPRVFYYLINGGLRVWGRDPLPQNTFLTLPRIGTYMIRYMIGHTINGIGFFFLVNTLTAWNLSFLIPSIGIFTLGGIFGILVLFAPAGLGAREGIITVLLVPYFSVEMAAFLALASRIWVTVGDALIGLYLLSYGMVQHRRKHT
jgi:hypothetical protein